MNEVEKEKFLELFDAYMAADKSYHDYLDGFFTVTWNGNVQREAVRGMNYENEKKLRELDKIRIQAQTELDIYLKTIRK